MLKLENILKSSLNFGRSLLFIGVLAYGCANDSALITTPTSIPTNARPPGATANLRLENVETTISYIDAINDHTKRQGWLDEVVAGRKPDYVVSVQYATSAILSELEKQGYKLPKGAYAATIPIEKDKVGKGTKSEIFVFPDAFKDMYEQYPHLEETYPKPQLNKDFGIIVENAILKNEFTDAQHFNQGIPGFPLESFVKSDGKINYPLYTLVIDLLSNNSEYIGLMQNPKNNESLKSYAYDLKKISSIFYLISFNSAIIEGMDEEFIERLNNNFHPRMLFQN